MSVQFSPTGRTWSAASTEGIHVYSLDEALLFDPFELDIDITKENILKTLHDRHYLKALVVLKYTCHVSLTCQQMSLQLNEKEVIKEVLESIASEDIQIVAQGMPSNYLLKLLSFIAAVIEHSPHLEFYMLWCIHLFNYHGQYLYDMSSVFMSSFRHLHKTILKHNEDLSKLYSILYLYHLLTLPI